VVPDARDVPTKESPRNPPRSQSVPKKERPASKKSK